jgi:hypothetical protein
MADEGLAERLEDAYSRRVKILALEISDRDTRSSLLWTIRLRAWRSFEGCS